MMRDNKGQLYIQTAGASTTPSTQEDNTISAATLSGTGQLSTIQNIIASIIFFYCICINSVHQQLQANMIVTTQMLKGS